jgi:hypothetical protein
MALYIGGCSDSSDSKADETAVAEPKADTSYLDQLAAEQGIELDQDKQEDTSEQESIASDVQEDVESSDEQEREWVKDEGSKSLFGRSRDKAKDLQNQIRGGTSPEDGLANTLLDEEYAASSGYRWEMPEDWRMAMPTREQFAQMYIMNALGNASVSFTKEDASVNALVRSMQEQIIDPMGGRSRAKTSQKTIQDKSVTIVDLTGTYLDPGAKGGTNEQIFYAIHAAIFDLGDSRVLIKMWGPEDTVNQSKVLFDKMINETSAE